MEEIAIRKDDCLKSTRIYFAPFHAMSGRAMGPCGSTIGEFNKALKAGDWPYDNGDDPSFYAARTFGANLSWGICRQDVRNNLNNLDIVVFFSFRKFKETGDSEYRLCAVATVEKRVSQKDIWQYKELAIYRRYFNLLIRPLNSRAGVWEHFEPTLDGSRLHHDWLWRIAAHQGFRKADFKKVQASNRLEPGTTVGGRPVMIADNYVLFSSDRTQTCILSNPPIVAWHSKDKPVEEWNHDKFSLAVRRRTLEVAQRANGRFRSLRIRNSQRAHRHICFELRDQDASEWRAELLALLSGL